MPDTPDDASLLAAVASGDSYAFEQIYRTHKDDLLALAGLMLGDRQAGEDVVHDVFVSFARQISRLKLTGSLKGYLLTSCANRARDLRRRGRSQENLAASPEVAVSRDPARLAEVADEAARAVSALARLPAEQREVVGLRIYGQLTFREIARTLETSINTAQSRYRYALGALRRDLNHENRRRNRAAAKAEPADHHR